MIARFIHVSSLYTFHVVLMKLIIQVSRIHLYCRNTETATAAAASSCGWRKKYNHRTWQISNESGFPSLSFGLPIKPPPRRVPSANPIYYILYPIYVVHAALFEIDFPPLVFRSSILISGVCANLICGGAKNTSWMYDGFIWWSYIYVYARMQTPRSLLWRSGSVLLPNNAH